MTSSAVPDSAAPLITLAKRWGIGDDYEREEAVATAATEDLQELVGAVDAAGDDFWDWLAGPASQEGDPSSEYLALTDLTMAADSARVKLGGRRSMNARPGADEAPRDRGGRHPIHYACVEKRNDDLRRWLEAGVDPSIADRHRWTPLHFAAQSLDPEAVRMLIDAGADLGARNQFGATPLLVALSKTTDDDHGVVGLLIDAGADIDAENDYGMSPRKLADRVSNWDLKQFLTRAPQRGE